MKQTFPTHLELKHFIKENPCTTICEIRDKFKQNGEDIISITKPECKNKQLILAYGINSNFFRYLQTFMKEDYVICKSDKMACYISDSTAYIGPGELLPVVLSIRQGC